MSKSYGNVAPATIGTIQRRLLVLENQGAAGFFGEPELDIDDFLRIAPDGRGFINILSAGKLMRSPRLYAIFLLWMLSELFEKLPEVGDLEKPKLVFFFDEAHLLFDNAPKNLLSAIEQVVRLIRSKGVGVYFVTQNPADVPETVLGQLGNRVQHALRASTPRDQKAVKAAADTFRKNPSFDTVTAITSLAVGEALVSMLDAKGNPEIVAKSLIAPPMASVGPITDAERQQLMQKSGLLGKYDTPIDRQSAFETLRDRSQPEARAGASWAPAGGLLGSIAGALGGLFGKPSGGRQRMSTGEIAGSISRADRRDQDRPSHFARGPRRQIEVVSAHSMLRDRVLNHGSSRGRARTSAPHLCCSKQPADRRGAPSPRLLADRN